MKKILKKIKLFLLSALILLASFIGVQSCAGVNVLSPKVATASAESVQQITDLTGTTWEWNDVVNLPYATYISYDITFTSNNETFTSLYYNSISDSIIIYYPPQGHIVYSDEVGLYWNELNVNYQTITITGGADATNATLIAWLEDNATLISGGGSSVEDLTRTYWVFNENISYSLGEEDAIYYDLWFYSSNDFETLISYDSILFELYDNELTITYISEGVREDIVYTTTGGWSDYENQYIYIADGNDVENTDLINIIDSNANQFQRDLVSFFGDSAYRYGYLNGVSAGYDYGVEIGYQGGYSAGFADGQEVADSIGQSMWDYMFVFIQNLFDALIALLSVELVRGVNLGLVTIGIPMVIWAIGAIIRLVLFFFGGGNS